MREPTCCAYTLMHIAVVQRRRFDARECKCRKVVSRAVVSVVWINVLTGSKTRFVPMSILLQNAARSSLSQNRSLEKSYGIHSACCFMRRRSVECVLTRGYSGHIMGKFSCATSTACSLCYGRERFLIALVIPGIDAARQVPHTMHARSFTVVNALNR